MLVLLVVMLISAFHFLLVLICNVSWDLIDAALSAKCSFVMFLCSWRVIWVSKGILQYHMFLFISTDSSMAKPISIIGGRRARYSKPQPAAIGPICGLSNDTRDMKVI